LKLRIRLATTGAAVAESEVDYAVIFASFAGMVVPPAVSPGGAELSNQLGWPTVRPAVSAALGELLSVRFAAAISAEFRCPLELNRDRPVRDDP